MVAILMQMTMDGKWKASTEFHVNFKDMILLSAHNIHKTVEFQIHKQKHMEQHSRYWRGSQMLCKYKKQLISLLVSPSSSKPLLWCVYGFEAIKLF